MWRLLSLLLVISVCICSSVLLTCKVEPTAPVFIKAAAFVSNKIIPNPSIADTVNYLTSDTLRVNDSVEFIGFAIPWDSKIGNVEWNFGDGGKSEDSIVTHTYSKSGIYKAVFSINGNGTASDTVMIFVNTPPDSVSILTPIDGATNQSITPTLSWKGYDQDFFDTSLAYTVVISKAPSFIADTILKCITATSIVLNIGLEKGDSISWFVVAQDRFNAQVSSRKVSFSTGQSSDATISNLRLSQGSMVPAFSPADSEYFDTVQNSVSVITFTAFPNERHAAISINGVEVNSTDSSVSVPLAVGSTSVKVAVTAADGATSKSYTINVTRLPSYIATLSSLKVTQGKLYPMFAETQYNYIDTVPFQTDSISIIPSSSDTFATITINGLPVKSGGVLPISLNSNQAMVLSVVVKAQDGITKKTYNINILKGVQSLIAPADVTAVAQGATSILLTWKETSTNHKGFVIERSLMNNAGFAVVCSTSQNIASYLDTNLLAGTRYFYRLFAFNSAGNSGYSMIDSAVTKVMLSVNANPPAGGSIAKVPDTVVFSKGDTVKLSAIPKTGYNFSGWAGGATGSANPLFLRMDSSRIVTGNFTTACCSLHVSCINGTIARTPDKSCYALGDTVKITVTPSTGYHFAQWSGDTTGTSNPLKIIMNSNKTIVTNCINRDPIINCPKDTIVSENVLLQFSMIASDPDGDPVTLLAGTLPTGATFNSSNGLFSWLPTHAQMGLCTLSIAATDGMLTTTQKIVISVKDLPIIDQQPQPQSPCVGQPAKFAISVSGTGPFAYQWKKGATDISGAAACSLTIAAVAISDSGAYSCSISNAGGTVTSAAVLLTVNTPPVIGSQIVNQVRCPGDSLSFVIGATGTTPLSYQWKKNGADITGATSNLFKINSLVFTDSGNYSCKVSNVCSNVMSGSAYLNVNSPSAAPTSITATPATICQGGSTVLNAVGGALGTGAIWKWYSGTCGGTLVGTGSSITISPTATTTFFVRAEGGCIITACASMTVTVKVPSTAPSSITATPKVICQGDSTSLTLSGGILGTNASWNWYAGNCSGGTYIGAGASFVVKPTATTIYSVQGRGDCNNTSWSCCTVTVSTPSVAPTAAAASPDTICLGASTTLTVNGGALGTGANWKWYSGSCAAGLLVGNGPSIIVSPKSTTTYFVRAEGACNTTACASVIVTVDSLSVDPTGAAANPINICSGSPTTISVSGGKLGYGAQWAWYTNSGCTGSPLATGASTSVSPASTTTYYVRAEGKCNTTNATSVSVPVTAIPAQPTNASATPSTLCLGGSTTLSATNSTTGAVLHWYSDAGCTLPLSGTTPTPPVGSTTYYVRAENGTCNSTPVSVPVTVTAIPLQPTNAAATPSTICQGSSTTLSATNSTTGAVLKWYSDAGCTSLLSSTTPTPPVGITIYYVRAENGMCFSSPVGVPVTVIALPAQPTNVLATPSTLCQGGSTILSATNPTAGTTLHWYSNAGCTTPLSSTTPTPPVGNTIYYVRAENGTCYSTSANVSVTVNPLPTVSFSAISPVCLNALAIPLSQGSPSGGIYSGPGITISPQFNPKIAGVGTKTLTYSYTNGNGCTSTASQSVTVQDTVATPVISFSYIDQGSCGPNQAIQIKMTVTVATPSIDAIYYSTNNGSSYTLYTGIVVVGGCCGSCNLLPVMAYAVKSGYCNSDTASKTP